MEGLGGFVEVVIVIEDANGPVVCEEGADWLRTLKILNINRGGLGGAQVAGEMGEGFAGRACWVVMWSWRGAYL